MKSRFTNGFVLLVCAVALVMSLPAAAVTNKYPVAHVKHQNSNMVIVVINPSFFRGSLGDQNRWFTDIEQCVRSVKLGGQALVVANDNGRFRFFGPKSWHNFLQTLDMNWVNARINKSLTCNF